MANMPALSTIDPLSTDAQSASHPYAPCSGRHWYPAVERPPVAELHQDGLTWIHLEAPTHREAQMLADRFGWHPLDVEDVLSRRQRPKVDVYTENEAGGYLFAVLHFPVYDANVGRLNAGELDAFVGPDYLVTLPAVELKPVTRLFDRCRDNEEFRQQLFSAARAACSTRCWTTSTTTASRSSTRST